MNRLSYGALEDPKLTSSSQLVIALPFTASPAAQAPPVAQDGKGSGVTMDPSSICTPDSHLMERRRFKKEAPLNNIAVEITDADGLVAEKIILSCGLRSNMHSFRVTCPFWVLVSSRKGEESLLVPLMYTRHRSTHVYLVGCFFDALGQLHRRRCFEWSHVLACNVVCAIDGHACQATAEACAGAFRVRPQRERENRLLHKTIDVDMEQKSTGQKLDVEQSDGGHSLGGRGKRRSAGVPTT